MSEFKESWKMKVVQLHEWTPKTVFEHHIEPKNSTLRSQKVKNNPKIKSKSNVRIGNKDIKLVALYEQTLKQFEPDHNPQIANILDPKSQKNYS